MKPNKEFWDDVEEPRHVMDCTILCIDPDREFDMDPLELLMRREEEDYDESIH